MPMVPFHERFPEVSDRETRHVRPVGNAQIPEAEYYFMESYCDEIGCDCRRVFINVITPGLKGMLATINYGWEGLDFYRNWMGSAEDEDGIVELKGPSLAVGLPQSGHAPALLGVFDFMVQSDADYTARLARHYRMLKEAVEAAARQRPEEGPGPHNARTARNDSCPCGSGRKHRKCCGRRT